jgi:hypothetical protein
MDDITKHIEDLKQEILSEIRTNTREITDKCKEILNQMNKI